MKFDRARRIQNSRASDDAILDQQRRDRERRHSDGSINRQTWIQTPAGFSIARP